MTLAIRERALYPDPRVSTAWNEILLRLERYSYFQTPAWSNLLAQTIPQAKPYHIWVRFNDGAEAILPLISLRKKFMFRKIESLPWGTYGGWLSASPLSQPHQLLALRQAINLIHATAVLHCNPLESVAAEETFFKYRTERWTDIVDVSCGFEELWMKFQPRNRTAIRRARDQGIAIRWGCGANEVETFHRLYLVAKQSWTDVETLPDAFFQALASAPSVGLTRIWIAEFEGNPVAANLILYGKGEAQYFAGASDRRFSHTNASRLLMCEILRDACDRRFHAVNMGASGGLPGVERFKRLFASEPRRYWSIQLHLFGGL